MRCIFSLQQEMGELRSKEDAQFRKDAEEHKARVVWPHNVVRVVLTKEAIADAQRVIAASRTMPVEITRAPVTAAQAAAKVCYCFSQFKTVSWCSFEIILCGLGGS
jgi:hypothetical protein